MIVNGTLDSISEFASSSHNTEETSDSFIHLFDLPYYQYICTSSHRVLK